MKKRLVICIILFIILTILIQTNNISWFDEPIYSFLISFKCNTLTNVMKIITFMASVIWIGAICTLSLLSLIWKKKSSFYIIPTVFLSAGSNLILKAIFRRERPTHLWLTMESGFSYPSGHAMESMAFYGTILVLVKYSNIKHKSLLYFLGGVLLFFIGISRVYLGVHYPSDVVGGWIIGYIFVILIDYIVGGIYEGTIKWSK